MKTTWEMNSVQFPRLLAEIYAMGLSEDQYDFLEESMDLVAYEIDSLFERADNEWQAIKDLNRRQK
jgi:hypothetical protein